MSVSIWRELGRAETDSLNPGIRIPLTRGKILTATLHDPNPLSLNLYTCVDSHEYAVEHVGADFVVLRDDLGHPCLIVLDWHPGKQNQQQWVDELTSYWASTKPKYQ